MTSPVVLRSAAAAMALASLSLLGALGWALGARFDTWEARPFVLLFYGAGAACTVGACSLLMLRRRGERLPAWPLRALLWVAGSAWVAGALWTWYPGAQVAVAYLLRHWSIWCLR